MRSKALFALYFASLSANLWLARPEWDWRILPAFLIGWYLADLGSGLVHMYMDYRPCQPNNGLKDLYFWQGPRDTPEFLARQAEVYGRISRFERLVYDFKKHHPFPDLLGRHSFIHLSKAPTFIAALPLSLLLLLSELVVPMPFWLVVGLVTMIVGTGMSQAFHGALHRDDVGPLLRLLRRCGLVMTRTAHQKHHEALTQDFAVISGWSNPLINLCARGLLQSGLLHPEGLEPSS